MTLITKWRLDQHVANICPEDRFAEQDPACSERADEHRSDRLEPYARHSRCVRARRVSERGGCNDAKQERGPLGHNTPLPTMSAPPSMGTTSIGAARGPAPRIGLPLGAAG